MTINDNGSNPAAAIQAFKGSDELSNSFVDIPRCSHRTRILIIGATGVGKSSLIAAVSGQTLAAGHDLMSGLPECYSSEYHSPTGQTVDLVDTLGFNNATRSDKDVLMTIISKLQANDNPIAGVIYMHRITDNRFTGTDRRILNILNAICGDNFAPHTVLCTTMWNTLPKAVVAAEAAVREQKLCESPQVWAPLINQGARYMRFTGDEDSGRAIIEHILSRPANRPMGIQLELRNANCHLQVTRAGQLIEAEARKREDRLRQEYQDEQAELCQRKRDLEAEVHRLERCKSNSDAEITLQGGSLKGLWRRRNMLWRNMSTTG